MLIGADSWLPPNQEVLNLLKELSGFKFYCGYVGGADLFQQTPWPIASWELLKENEIDPVPIWVPKQDCSEDPVEQAHAAIAACEAMGLYGSVAIDSEHSMSSVMNFQSWLDRCFQAINDAGWFPINYEGSHYVSSLAYQWQVVWGEHELVPPSGQAMQYGPYALTLSNGSKFNLDADSADEHFPTASFTLNPNPVPNPNPTPNPVPPVPNPKEVLTHMDMMMDNGKIIIAGPARDNGNLLVFTSGDNSTWSVEDVTDKVHNENPSDPRRYQID